MTSRFFFASCFSFPAALAFVNCTSWGNFWAFAPPSLTVLDSLGKPLASGATVAFGSTGMGTGGTTKTIIFKVTNAGEAELVVSNIVITPPTNYVILGGSGFNLGAYESVDVRVRYTPSTPSDDAVMTVISNAGSATLNFNGSGISVNSGLSFWLKLNGNILDSSGNANHGAVVGTGITYGADRNGTVNSAGVFDGTGQGGNYIAVNLASGWAWNSTYSISAWIRTANSSGASLLARQQTMVGSARLDFGFYPGNYRVSRDAFSGGGWATVDMPSTIDVDVWTHLVFVSNGGNITVYRNGVSVGTGAVAGSPTAGSNSVDLGVGILLPSLSGSLADVHVYGATAITPVQAQALFNQD
jgi:hypothetical protein